MPDNTVITTDNNYVVGRGRIFFNKFNPGTYIGSGERYFGNTPSLEVTQASTDLKHYSSEQGLKIQDKAVTLQKDITAQFGCDNVSEDNLNFWWGGDSSDVVQEPSGSPITEDFTVTGGSFYQIGVTNGNPMGVSNLDPTTFTATAVELVAASGTVTFTAQPAANDTITLNGTVLTFVAAGAAGPQINLGGNFPGTAQNLLAYINANSVALGVLATGGAAVLTLTDNTPGTGGNAYTLAESSAGITLSGATLAGGSAGSSEPLVAGVDWNPDPDGGRFQIIDQADGGHVADDSVVVISYELAQADVSLLQTNEEDIYGELRFVADNPVGDNTDYFWPYVILRSSGNMQLKGDTWQEMTFSAEILQLPNMQRVYMRKRPGVAA
jgi:hypothetical protein